jgi:hypothetical protein
MRIVCTLTSDKLLLRVAKPTVRAFVTKRNYIHEPSLTNKLLSHLVKNGRTHQCSRSNNIFHVDKGRPHVVPVQLKRDYDDG